MLSIVCIICYLILIRLIISFYGVFELRVMTDVIPMMSYVYLYEHITYIVYLAVVIDNTYV